MGNLAGRRGSTAHRGPGSVPAGRVCGVPGLPSSSPRSPPAFWTAGEWSALEGTQKLRAERGTGRWLSSTRPPFPDETPETQRGAKSHFLTLTTRQAACYTSTHGFRPHSRPRNEDCFDPSMVRPETRATSWWSHDWNSDARLAPARASGDGKERRGKGGGT